MERHRSHPVVRVPTVGLLLACALLASGCARPTAMVKVPSGAMAAGRPEGPNGHRIEALEHSAELRAAFADWRAAVEAAAASGSLPAPQLSYGAWLRPVETRTGAQRHRVGISQSLPWQGTRSLERQKALAMADAAWYRLESVRRRILHEVEISRHDLAYLQRALAITREDLRLVTYYGEVTQEAIRTGGPKDDALEAQMERTTLADRISSLESRRSVLSARFNMLLDRPLDTPVEVADPPEPGEPEAVPVHEGNSPQLAGWQSRIRAAELGVDLARKAFWPRVTLGVDYVDTRSSRLPGRTPEASDPVMLRTALSLPFWQRESRQASLRQAQYHHQGLYEAADEARRRLEAKLAGIDHRLHDARYRIDLSRSSHQPLAESALQIHDESYRAGQGDFLRLIESRRHLLEIRLDRERTLADHAILRADRNLLAGAALPAPPHREP